MSKKKIIILVSIFLILGIGIGLVVWNSIKVSKNNEVIINEIRDNYKSLEEDITTYNNIRSNLVSSVNSYYSSDMDKYYDNFINSLNDVDKLLKDVYKKVSKLDDLCLDRLFKDGEINNICNKYKVYYETLNNIFVSDVKKVNDIIDLYNNEYSSVLEIYSNKLDYIDYNKDGVFLEREDK